MCQVEVNVASTIFETNHKLNKAPSYNGPYQFFNLRLILGHRLYLSSSVHLVSHNILISFCSTNEQNMLGLSYAKLCSAKTSLCIGCSPKLLKVRNLKQVHLQILCHKTIQYSNLRAFFCVEMFSIGVDCD